MSFKLMMQSSYVKAIKFGSLYFFLNNLLNAINECFLSHGYLVIRTTSMLVSLRSVLPSALSRILGKRLGPIPACALSKLFNYHLSALQSTVHFVIVLAMLLIM